MRHLLEELFTFKGLALYGCAFVFLVFLPIIAVIRYQKKGGRKAWPRVLAWVLIAIFAAGVISVVILGQIYSPASEYIHQ